MNPAPKNILPKLTIFPGKDVSIFFDIIFSVAHRSVAMRMSASPLPKLMLVIFRNNALPMSKMRYHFFSRN